MNRGLTWKIVLAGVQQLREAFPFDSAPRHLIFDRDATFNPEVLETATTLGVKPVRTSFKSPWQNGVAERFVGSCRRELLDHVIPFNKRHLKRLMTEYVRYHHDDRTHLGLDKQTPASRKAVIALYRTRKSSPYPSSVVCIIATISRPSFL